MFAFLSKLFDSHNKVAPWITILLGFSYIWQVILSALLILCFCCNQGFRKKPGSIILFYAISAFGVSIIGGIEHYGSIGDQICQSLGFLALFFQYNCLYYEMGFITFFVYDFKKFIKTKFEKSIGQARSLQVSRRGSIIENSDLKTEEKIKEKENIGEQEAQSKKIQDDINEKTKNIEILIEKNRKLKYSFSRARLQKKINCIVLILSLTSALIPTFSKNLGPNMFGGCSEQFDPSKVQELSMGFYLFIAATNAAGSALGLISFFQQKKNIEKKILKPLDRDLTEKEMKEIKHYMFDVFLFIAVTTLCCWVFSGLNIYAAITVLNNSNSKWNEQWSEIKWDVLVLLRLTQEMAVLVFKLMEPMVKNALKETFKGCWESLKRYCGSCWGSLKRCCHREEPQEEDKNTEIRISLLDNE